MMAWEWEKSEIKHFKAKSFGIFSYMMHPKETSFTVEIS